MSLLNTLIILCAFSKHSTIHVFIPCCDDFKFLIWVTAWGCDRRRSLIPIDRVILSPQLLRSLCSQVAFGDNSQRASHLVMNCFVVKHLTLGAPNTTTICLLTFQPMTPADWLMLGSYSLPSSFLMDPWKTRDALRLPFVLGKPLSLDDQN